MEGVTILYQMEVFEDNQLFWIFGGALFILSLIFEFIVFLTVDEDWMYRLGIVGVVIGIIVIMLAIPLGHKEYQYKVTVDDSVSMVEFYEKYEIVNTEGKIFTVKEK